ATSATSASKSNLPKAPQIGLTNPVAPNLPITFEAYAGVLSAKTSLSPLSKIALFPLRQENAQLPLITNRSINRVERSAQAVEPIEVVARKSFNLGLYAQLSQEAPGPNSWIAGIGLMHQGFFGGQTRWGWQVQLGYQWADLESRELEVVEQITQGFYTDLDQRRLVATGSHGLESGLFVQYRMQRQHHLIAGMEADLALAWRGQMELLDYLPEYERTQEEQTTYQAELRDYYRQVDQSGEVPVFRRTIVESRGWVPISQEEQMHYFWSLGYRYDHPANWSLGLRYRRSIGGIAAATSNPLTVQFVYWLR
ncbi:MAG: hypothetical protein AAGH79_13180, partial [Bacteroidota bacterium]